jgi:hypothetical protein
MSKVLGKGNFVVAKVNGSRVVLTSAELQRLLDDGEDVEVVSPS